MREKILGFIAYALIRLIGMTLRYKVHYTSEEAKKFFIEKFKDMSLSPRSQYLMAFYHQDELCLLNYFRKTNLSTLVSISKDGEIMTQAATRLGYHPVRGSSSKKAVSGLIAAIKKVRQGYKMAFAVDGPRAPIYKVKEGIIAVSQKTNVPILPVRGQASHLKYFEKSWNKAKFPYPFARLDIYIGEPRMYQKDELEEALNNLL